MRLPRFQPLAGALVLAGLLVACSGGPDPAKSLAAVQKHRVNTLGQIPALFALQWRLPDYDSYDLSSLEFALYGGQQVTRQFLDRLSQMAPRFGTGLGLTECGGFCRIFSTT